MAFLRNEAQANLRTHIQGKLQEEYQNSMVGINQALKVCWEIVNKSKIVNNDTIDADPINSEEIRATGTCGNKI